MTRARFWIPVAAALVALTMLGAHRAQGAVVRWSLEQNVKYYDDVWVGEIISRDLFTANTFGEPLTHTELTIKGYSVVTGKKGYQRIDFLGGGGLHVSTMPLPANTRVGGRVLVFLKAEPHAVARGAMWTSNFTTLLRLEQPRAASAPVVIAQDGSFLDRHRKLPDLEREIRSVWHTVKTTRKGR